MSMIMERKMDFKGFWSEQQKDENSHLQYVDDTIVLCDAEVQ